MITGFEEQTESLNEYEEKVLLPVIARCLSNKIGKEKAVKSGFIVSRMKECGYSLNDARLRKIIHHIRREGIVERLVATSAGYYVSNDKEEGRAYVKSLEGRERAVRDLKDAVKKQFGL